MFGELFKYTLLLFYRNTFSKEAFKADAWGIVLEVGDQNLKDDWNSKLSHFIIL